MTDRDRGRVPFALVGVLLLVSSATLAATSGPPARVDQPAVGRTLERASAESQTAIREGVRAASRDAARAPVIDRANTSAGRVLNASTPFRDSLRIRIYLAVRTRLAAIDRRRGDVRATAALPAPSNPTALRAAKRRVHLRRADANGTAMTVTIENVTLRATRGGTVVSERTVSPEVTVATPVLALHERVATYQRRLDAGVEKPGLEQRLTAQLYALAWARGYAQYGGAPIDNVVANRHVAIATNAGLLSVQETTIGHSDPDGRRTLAKATARAGAMDLFAASGASSPPGVSNPLAKPTAPPPNDVTGLRPPESPRPDDERVVGVNRTADAALMDLVSRGGLNGSIRTVYSADARLIARSETVSGGRPQAPNAPPGDWTLVEQDRSVSVAPAGGASVSPPPAPDGWHRFESYGRRVAVTRTHSRTWRRGNETRAKLNAKTETVTVAVAVVGRHHTSERVPTNSISGVHERGTGALDGPNLAGVRNRSIRRLVGQRGGSQTLVRRAATGTLDGTPIRVSARRPDGLQDWTYRDLMRLRERVRNVTVTVERGDVGSFETSPPARLAAELRARRAELVDAPARYDGAADKARTAARAAYVDRVIARLEERADRRAGREDRAGDAIADRTNGSLSAARRGASATGGPTAERGSTVSGVGGPVTMRVDGAPSYLTTAEVTREQVPAMDGPGHPMVARNVNLFTVPYGDGVDAVVNAGGGSGGVRIGTAARTLRATNATLERRSNETLRARRDALQREVHVGNSLVAGELVARLSDLGVGDSHEQRREIVRDGLLTWDTTAARGIAISNGSVAAAVAREAADQTALTVAERDRLRLRLIRTTREARDEKVVKADANLVEGSRNASQSVAERRARAVVSKRSKEWARNASRRAATRVVNRTSKRVFGTAFNETFSEMPAGLPLAPAPGYWYATSNVWHVQVRGEYARFGIRASRGRPTAPGGELVYVRDGDRVRVDVDGDGHRELLGRSTRVSFEVSSTVVVVVPPGGSGVGDRGGNFEERTEGWPTPGPE